MIFISRIPARRIFYGKFITWITRTMFPADNTIYNDKKDETYIKALEEHPNYQNQMLNFEAGLFLSYKVQV